MNPSSLGAEHAMRGGTREYKIFRLDSVEKAGAGQLSRLPYSIRVLLENLLRCEDGVTVKRSDIEYVAAWNPTREAQEIAFMPARVLLQDFTGVPCVVELAAMPDAPATPGADPKPRSHLPIQWHEIKQSNYPGARSKNRLAHEGVLDIRSAGLG